LKKYLDQITQSPTRIPIRVPSCTLILLNDQAQLLLLNNKQQNQWQLPLTDIRPDESATSCTMRMAVEQTSIELDDIECVGYSSMAPESVTLWSDTQVQLHSFIMVSTSWQGNLHANEEFAQMKFFGIQSLPELPNHTLQAISLFKKWLPSRVFQFG